LFATLADGISELLETLEKRVAATATIRKGTPIESIAPDRPDGPYRLEFPSGPPEDFDAIVLALPAHRAAGLVENFAPAWARALERIEYASSAIVVSGHKLADVRHPLDAFGLVVPATERRRILAVSFTSRKFPNRAPEGCVQLRTFVGGAMQPELYGLSDEEICTVVREELSELLGVTRPADFMIVARYPQAMPQYHVGHLDLVAEIESLAAGFPQLALAGNAYAGVGIPDCIHSAELAAERLEATAKTSAG
jgi:oxygen-dependent protoporphyrinogen oxidase